jgi:TRAP-type C4-dicarboxylate transport system permease small subunit
MFRFITAIDKILSKLCIAFMGIMILAVIFSVIMRYFFAISFRQIEEGICMLFNGTTFFGVALGIREKDHISIPYFTEKAASGMKKILLALSMGVVICVSLIVFFQSLVWIEKVGNVVSVPLRIPYYYCYAMVPVSTLFVVFYASLNILSLFIRIPDVERGYLLDEEIACSEIGIK